VALDVITYTKLHMSIRNLTIVLTSIFSLYSCVSRGPGPEQTHVLEGISTPESCLASDAMCLQNKFEIACANRSLSVIATCQAWLQELERIPEPAHTEVKLAKGYTYYRFFEFSRSGRLQEQSAGVEELVKYRLRARDAYQEVYDSDRNNTQAMLGLSTTSDSEEEKLQWKRRIIRVTPDPFICRSLQSSLNSVHGYNERAGWSEEVAECYVESYFNVAPDLNKWRSGAAAVNSYREADHELEASEFLRQLRADINPRGRIRRLKDPGRLTPDEVEHSLMTLCLRELRGLLDGDYCVEGISTALHSLANISQASAVPYANSVMAGIRERLRPAGMVVDVESAENLAFLRTEVERSVISPGLESGVIYSTYSQLAGNDLEKSLSAQIKAVDLEPENGFYRVELGHLYHRSGELRLAKQHYEEALEFLPEYLHASFLGTIRQLESEIEAGI